MDFAFQQSKQAIDNALQHLEKGTVVVGSGGPPRTSYDPLKSYRIFTHTFCNVLRSSFFLEHVLIVLKIGATVGAMPHREPQFGRNKTNTVADSVKSPRNPPTDNTKGASAKSKSRSITITPQGAMRGGSSTSKNATPRRAKGGSGSTNKSVGSKLSINQIVETRPQPHSEQARGPAQSLQATVEAFARFFSVMQEQFKEVQIRHDHLSQQIAEDQRHNDHLSEINQELIESEAAWRTRLADVQKELQHYRTEQKILISDLENVKVLSEGVQNRHKPTLLQLKKDKTDVDSKLSALQRENQRAMEEFKYIHKKHEQLSQECAHIESGTFLDLNQH